ncbi:MAG TPA: hypothetical protein VFZ37_21880 [Jiangellaceae bacterium]
MSDVVRLAMWSGPRNISTAMMRSWENRPDAIVVDEPLYAYYLAATGADHPAREEVIATGETDWRAVVATLLGPVPDGIRVFYQKHMSHHLLPDTGRDWIAQLTNILLIRDPREVVASYGRIRDTVTPHDIGLPQQVELYDRLAADGSPPAVLDAADFLRDPEGYLRALCDMTGLEFTGRMLSWPAGPRDSDGVWAPHWYDAVWKSTGFAPYQERRPALSGSAAEAAEAAWPMYEYLHARRDVLA